MSSGRVYGASMSRIGSLNDREFEFVHIPRIALLELLEGVHFDQLLR